MTPQQERKRDAEIQMLSCWVGGGKRLGLAKQKTRGEMGARCCDNIQVYLGSKGKPRTTKPTENTWEKNHWPLTWAAFPQTPFAILPFERRKQENVVLLRITGKTTSSVYFVMPLDSQWHLYVQRKAHFFWTFGSKMEYEMESETMSINQTFLKRLLNSAIYQYVLQFQHLNLGQKLSFIPPNPNVLSALPGGGRGQSFL